jgi:hypothetical protein
MQISDEIIFTSSMKFHRNEISLLFQSREREKPPSTGDGIMWEKVANDIT